MLADGGERAGTVLRDPGKGREAEPVSGREAVNGGEGSAQRIGYEREIYGGAGYVRLVDV